MNATRAATIRLRSSFDGAVSLGRVQTPTLAILARREQEIRDFKPEPYWVVDALFDPVAEPLARVRGPLPRRRQPADQDRRGGRGGRRAPATGQTGEITKLEKSERKERAAAALRPDLAPARRQQPLRLHARGARWPPPSACTRSTRR